MRILLVQPRRFYRGLSVDDFACFRPLALETLAASLHNHDVQILDCRFEEDVSEIITEFSPHVVALTALTTTVYSALYVLNRAKLLLPRVVTVIGGQHASLSPMDLCHPFVDFIVIGEGEQSFPRLIELLDKGGLRQAKAACLRQLEGIAVPSNGALNYSKPFKLIDDLDACAFPDRSLTKRYDAHYLWIDNSSSMAPMQTSRGCSYNCKFCGESILNKGKHRVRSPRRVAEEIKSIESEYIYLVDNNFFEHSQRLKELCAILARGRMNKNFFAMGRAESIAKRPELIEELREIGLCGVLVGFEDFRNENLTELGTPKRSAYYRKAINILNQNDIFLHGSFIINPNFSRDDFAYFKDLILSLEIAHYDLQILTPLPGTRLYKEVKDDLLSHDLRLYDGFHLLLPSRLPRDEFYTNYIDLHLSTWRNTSKKIYFRNRANLVNYIPISKAMQNYKTLLNLPNHESLLSESECTEEFVPDYRIV